MLETLEKDKLVVLADAVISFSTYQPTRLLPL